VALDKKCRSGEIKRGQNPVGGQYSKAHNIAVLIRKTMMVDIEVNNILVTAKYSPEWIGQAGVEAWSMLYNQR
jgi:hypothetical protein